MTPAPSRRVAAKRASAVRDRVIFPVSGYWKSAYKQSLKIVMPHMWQVEPPSQCEWLPFGGLIRRKLGSSPFSIQPETSCDLIQVINKCSVILRVNNLFTIYYFEILASKVIVSPGGDCASNDQH